MTSPEIGTGIYTSSGIISRRSKRTVMGSYSNNRQWPTMVILDVVFINLAFSYSVLNKLPMLNGFCREMNMNL